MKRNRVKIEKSEEGEEKKQIFRLTDIEPQFVSIVTAGANRQKKFQVVKADDGTAPGTPAEKNAGGDRSVENGTEVPGVGEPAIGQNNEKDFIDWLEDVGKSVSQVLEDAQVTEILLASTSDVGSFPEQSTLQQQVGKSSEKIEKAFAELQGDFATTVAKNKELSCTIEKQSREIAAIKKQLATVTAERNKYRSKAVKFKNGVGGTTALITGNVFSAEKTKEGDDPIDAAWAAGGDLASKVNK